MKNINILYFALLCQIGLWSCNSNDANDSGLYIANIEEALSNIEDVKLSDYATDINYYTLETADSCLLGIFSKISFTDDMIFIGSTDKMKTIHQFTRDGKFIKNVGIRGRGKGEYLAIRSIIPLTDMNAIMVEGGPKAVIYSLEDGNAIKDIYFDQLRKEDGTLLNNPDSKNPHSIYNIEYDGKGNFYILTFNVKSGCQNLIATDTSLVVKNTIKLRSGEKSISEAYTQRGGVIKSPAMAISGISYMYDDKINFFHGMNDTLYVIEDNKPVPKLAVDYGYYCKDLHNVTAEDIWVKIRLESDNIIFMEARMPLSNQQEANSLGTAHILYDKANDKTRLMKFTENLPGDQFFTDGGGAFFNDLDGGLPFWPIHIHNNKMYMACDAGKFIELSQKYNSPKMKEVASRINEESNPILIEVVLK